MEKHDFLANRLISMLDKNKRSELEKSGLMKRSSGPSKNVQRLINNAKVVVLKKLVQTIANDSKEKESAN